MTFVHPKSLQNDLKRLQNAYSSISSSHASTVLLSVLHDHLCKMLIAAPPSISFSLFAANVASLPRLPINTSYASSTSINISEPARTSTRTNWNRHAARAATCGIMFVRYERACLGGDVFPALKPV